MLDGGRVSALERLRPVPQSWICQQYARQGFTVGAVHKGDHLTAHVDTGFLWKMAVLDVKRRKGWQAVAQLLEGVQHERPNPGMYHRSRSYRAGRCTDPSYPTEGL